MKLNNEKIENLEELLESKDRVFKILLEASNKVQEKLNIAVEALKNYSYEEKHGFTAREALEKINGK